MTSITLDTTVARSDGLLAAELDDETVLLGMEQQAYFGLDKTGQAIWQQMEQPRRVREIVAALTARYAVEPDVCAAQTLAFLRTLASQGLIRSEGGEAA